MDKVQLEDLVEFSKSMRVLLVESDEILNRSELDVFKIFFDQIDSAKSINEGYQYFLNNKYNLIITSLELKDGSGVELISKIRKISRDITIFVISKESDKKHFMNLIKLGTDGYVIKPVKVTQFVEVFQKVIEKFKYKQEVYEYKLQLEEIIKEKTKKLEQLNLTLELKVKEEVQKNIKQEKLLFEQSKLASMGEMIGNIAHQWRQPLSSISTSASGMVAQKEHNVLTDELFYNNCDTIVKSTTYLSKTIDDFRDYIKEDKQKINFYISNEIDHFISLISSTAKTNNISIISDNIEDVELYGYPNELVQAIVNIFNNSKDALNLIDIENRYFFISVKKEDKKLILELTDNANGISNKNINKIFEPYFTTKHKSQGTGLGLHITYNIIVNSMGGSIEVQNSSFEYLSNNYKGANFKITIPLD